MRKTLLAAAALLLSAGLVLWAMSPQSDVSAELKQMYEQDQAERREGRLSPQRDRERLERVRKLLLEGALASPQDSFHAAMIFQHSADRTGRDHLLAHVLATASAMDGYEKARWLSGAALDRFLVFNGQEQFFGTQFQRDDNGHWKPGARDVHRTEAIRGQFRMPDNATMQQRADSFNK